MNSSLKTHLSNTAVKLIFEDEFMFILSKPANLHSVEIKSATNISSSSVAGILAQTDLGLENVAENPGDYGLVNRLDFETSGLIIGAKNKDIWHRLRNDQEIKKTYCAIVEGKFPSFIRAKTWIGSRYRGSKKVSVVSSDEKCPRRFTESKTELRFSQYNSQKYLSLIEAKLLTGKRHQIRAHCGYLGFPLLGDTLYGSKYVIEEEELTNRPAFFLHSQKLEFYHPKTRENLAFEAILPDYFLHYFEINN